jgi:dipeptidase E
MPGDRRRIVAMGGASFLWTPDNPLLEQYILGLARDREQRPARDPRVCFLPTASADNDAYVARFYRAFSALDCRATDLRLFERTVANLESFLLEQDVIYVCGGNTANALAVWRAHGVDTALRRAWESGVVLSGWSAGMICWFEESTTDSFNLGQLAPLHDGLGFIEGSACPHYDGEVERRPLFQKLIGEGSLKDGWAADDGAALVFAGTELREAVSSRRTARGYRVRRTGEGQVDEAALPTRYLG